MVKRDGVIPKVLGDPQHGVARGALCGKCAIAYNGVWRDQTQRLSTPLKREGSKGLGQFVPATWDEALCDIGGRLAAIARTRPASVLHTHYTGTCSLLAGIFPQRFFNALGATEVDPDTVCNKAGHAALGYALGSSTDGFDPREAARAACILVWGANPSATAPHMHKHWLPESPAIKIVIDPIRHDTAAAAYLHLQPYPGSDAALAFAMMHVAVTENLIDANFIAKSVLGFDDLAATLPACTPHWGQAVTGVPAADIVRAARLFAAGPSLLWLGQGMQRQKYGGNAFRAAVALAAITGNIGKPGAGICYLNGPATRGIDTDRIARPDLHANPHSISHMQLAATLANPSAAQALVSWNNNIVASSPNQSALRQALLREDLLHVAIDLFATDTTAYADWILPAASFLEFDDLVVPYFNQTLSAQVKATDPPGQALPNMEIFRRLALASGLTDPALQETDHAMIAAILAQTSTGLDFTTLAERGTVEVFAHTRIPFADGVFATPSGRIEIASAAAQADGHPLLPTPHADAWAPAPGVLRVLSPASRWTMNSLYANDPAIRAKLGPASATLNPHDAASLGINAGDHITLTNGTGSLNLLASVSDTVPPGVALVPKGRWPLHEASGANVNVLFGGDMTDMAQSSAVHAVEAKITRA